jgi:hypothetical protein
MTPEDLFKFKRDLNGLRERIEELSSAINEHSKTLRAAEEASRAYETVPKPVPVLVSYDQQTSGDQNRHYAIQKKIARWTKGAVIAASIYAAIAGLQWCEMRKATRASQEAVGAAQSAAHTAQTSLTESVESFRLDERAWVEIGRIDKTTFPPDPPIGTTFKFAFYPKNVGKTVATDVVVHLDNVSGYENLSQDEHGIRMFEDQLFKQQGADKRLRTPAKPAPETLAPGDSAIAPIYSGGQEPKFLGGSHYWCGYVIGRIDYVDAFKTKHWKHLCFMVVDAKGDLANCQFGNDEDNNPENPN